MVSWGTLIIFVNTLPVLVGGSESLWWPFYLRHIPLSVLVAGRGDFLSEGGSDWTVAFPDRILPEPPAGREPRAGPVWLDGRDVRQRGRGDVDGQRSSEVKVTLWKESVITIHLKETCIHRFVSEILLSLFRYLLPALCHLSAEEGPRKVLLTLDTPALLVDFLSQCWSSLKGKSGVGSSRDPSMETACSALLNFTVTEPERVR